MKKTKICIISFGPVELKSNGYFIRVWNILKELSRFYEIIVLEFPEVKIEDKIKRVGSVTFIRLRGNESSQNAVSRVMKRVFTFDPFHNLKFQIFSFLELWKNRKQISSADLIIVESSLIPAGIIIAKLLGKKVVLDTHSINKLLAKGFKKRNLMVYFLRTILWDFLERFTIKLSNIVITVSNKEKEFIVKEYKIESSRVFVVPNVIEPPEKVPEDIIKDLRKKLGLENKVIVTFVGDLESVQNADAVEYIINELAPWFWRKRKDVVFLIIGKGSERFNCKLPNIVFTGFVKNLAPYLAMSDICIAPLRVGAGTKTKILECLAYGKPVITTLIGIEGLEQLLLHTRLIQVVPINKFKNTLARVIKEFNIQNNKGDVYKYIQALNKEFKDNLLKAVKEAI